MKYVLMLLLAVIYLLTHNARLKQCNYLAKKYAGNIPALILMIIVWLVVQYGSVLNLVFLLSGLIDVFVSFYILLPIFVEGNRILFEDSDKWSGWMNMLKAGYLAVTVGVSIAQLIFGYSDPIQMLLGISIALAIFDGTDALIEGVRKLNSSK